MTKKEQNFTLNTRGDRPTFFENSETDAVMTALLETMSQLWATRNQVRMLEQLLIDKSLITREELETFDFNSAEKIKDYQSMQDFFRDAFRAMGASGQSVDSRQREVDGENGSNKKRD